MKGSENKKKNGMSLRTWGFLAGGALLLAILTLVLCIMGGVFDFHSGGAAATASPSPTSAAVTDAPAPVPTEAATPSPSPTPTEEPVKKYSITAISGKGGSISPSGLVSVEEGGSVTFTVSTDSGYYISELKIDGVSVEAASSYTFSGVTGDHSIYAVFREIPAATPTPTAETGGEG